MYQLFISYNPTDDLATKTEVFRVLLGTSMGVDDFSETVRHLTKEQVKHLVFISSANRLRPTQRRGCPCCERILALTRKSRRGGAQSLQARLSPYRNYNCTAHGVETSRNAAPCQCVT
jgi:hypothetical protein